MNKQLISLLVLMLYGINANSQVLPTTFGDGLQVLGKDSSYFIKVGFRFQSLYIGSWDVNDGSLSNYEANFLTRRSRFKVNGWALNPNLTYKFELGLSNRDISGGQGDEFSNTANVILDAYFTYKFYKNFSIRFGQGKLPGNRERVISSGNLQFVNRSLLNSRYNIDRDFGLQVKHTLKLSEHFFINKTLAFSQGEGRNVTEGHFDGFSYALHVEFLPFGKFKSKGDYSGSDLAREDKGKLAIAFAYEINENAVRERGQLGNFIQDIAGNYVGKDLFTFFADVMYKYNGFSFMAEYVSKKTNNNNPFVYDQPDNLIGIFFTGTGYNLQSGYLFDNNWEIAGRFTSINPTEGVSTDENQYTIGISKFIVGHKLKIQHDFTLRDRVNSMDNFVWRTQFEFHF